MNHCRQANRQSQTKAKLRGNGRYKYIITHGNEDGFEVITKKIIN